MKFVNVMAFVAIVALSSCVNTTMKDSSSVGKSDTTAQDSVRHRISHPVTIAMNGDMMLGSIKPTRRMPPNDGKDLFRDCDSILKSADVACGNLEGVLADNGTTRKRPGPLSFSFMMPTRFVNLMVDAGYDFMGIANNHIFDFYDAGIQSTIKTLKDAGIGVAGTKDCETSVKEINGVKYGFCAFGHEDYSLKTQDTVTVARIVKQLRKDCDIVIVCFHGGAEGTSKRHVPYGTEYFHGMDRGDVRKFAHLCIDSGADIVYGHGPHVPRGMELYNDHLIAYSLGNFATMGMSTAGQTGHAPLLVARLGPDGKFLDGKIHSFLQGSLTGPRRDPTNAVPKDMRELTLSDFKDNKLNLADDGTITRL